ncbi:hypothetical protein AOLI_G00018490 [Acnodon oligacanthus]
MVKGNGDNSNHNKMLSTLSTEPCHHDPEHFTISSKYPLASCLKTKSKKVLESHSEPQSSSRIGRRVTFKLPEDEENSKSNEDITPNKDPPPVLAKPKLNPLQLQILHKQVLLEQQQESDIQNLEHSESDEECLNQCNKQSPPQASSPTSSGSTSSPIQNPVAFLSSVLPSLPTSPPTNAMGLPMRAPRPQATLKKNHRSPWSRPDENEDICDGRVTLSHDIEKKLQLKNELPLYGQQVN